VGWPLAPFLVAGPFLVIAYNAELFGGVVHTDAGFAVAWGAFPVLTAYVAQTGALSAGAVIAAIAAFGLSAAQRSLSTPARTLRRKTSVVTGLITLADGDVIILDSQRLLRPLELALRSMSWSIVALAAALAVARLG
jgi:cytochrome bd-type quinol oxidase subunit 2